MGGLKCWFVVQTNKKKPPHKHEKLIWGASSQPMNDLETGTSTKRVNTDLLASVDDVLGVGQAVDAGPPDDWVVPRRSMGHFHGAELQEGFAQGHATEQHLPAQRDNDESTAPAAGYLNTLL